MKGIILAVGLLIVATTVLAATAQRDWIGTYQTKQTQLMSPAKSDNYLTITRMSGGGARFAFESASATCVGEADFRTAKVPNGNDIMLSTYDDSGGVCVMRVHREGNIIVTAEDGCDGLHGGDCTFSGTYKPEKRR